MTRWFPRFSLLILAGLILFLSACVGDTVNDNRDPEDGDDPDATDGDRLLPDGDSDSDFELLLPDGDDPDGDDPDGDDPDGDDPDGDESDGDMPDGDEPASAWEDVKILTIEAPDERTVVVRFDRDPGSERAERRASYGLDSLLGALSVASVVYEADTSTATLTSARQKLGVEYTLSIADGDDIGPSEVFWSADERNFWVTDFSSQSYEDEEITAYRRAVGQHCVIYVQDGYAINDAQSLLDTFDDDIYPTLTDLLADAPDFDENDKILLLALDGQNYYGGYFSSINQYSNATTMSWWGLHSNEMDMIHLNVVTDPQSFPHIIAHEFQHLLYHGYHGFTEEYWEYHDEGLAESAINAVYGENTTAVQFFQWDPDGLIGDGLSLAHWRYAEYANYAVAYLFWAYVAGQMTGDVAAYADIFTLSDGSPEEVNTFLQTEIGMDLPTAYQRMLAAFWTQADSGLYSFNGLASATVASGPTVSTGTTSLNLEPFAGALFKLTATSVDYPGTQGADIRYLGIDGSGNIDETAPFNVQGGALLVANTSMDYSGWPTQASGPDQPAQSRAVFKAEPPVSMIRHLPTWTNPPPFNPMRPASWQAWRHARFMKLGR